MQTTKLKDHPELYLFLTQYISEADIDADEKSIHQFTSAAPLEKQAQVIAQIKNLLSLGVPPQEFCEELGMEANRWFADGEEALAWFNRILEMLEATQNKADSSHFTVKDSNGTALSEGDSVQVIKDLKVKGGSSDLKRGTLIKKIHLIDDPENIECRVDGSTLVLKTCFLKKA